MESRIARFAAWFVGFSCLLAIMLAATAPAHSATLCNPQVQTQCAKVDSSGNVPVVGTISGTVSQNVAQVGGTAIDTNSGNKSAGTQRVVIATDQPTVPVSVSGGATAANQTNVQAAPTAAVPATVNFSEPVDSTGAAANFSSTAPVQTTSQYPVGASPITGNATGTTGAVVGTLAGVANKTTYICGLDVSATGGTAAVGPVTVAGLTGSSMVFQFFSTASGANLTWNFPMCIPASAVNTSITITTTADGTASAVDVNSWGYQL